MKSIAIIEDDPTIRENVVLFVKAKSKFEVVIEADSVEAFFEQISVQPKPDLLLLDIGLPGISGVKAIPIIKEKIPEVNIIMLTTYEEEDIIFGALEAGACSYISKRTSLVRILDAITIVSEGGSYMSPSIAKKVIDRLNVTQKKKKHRLTERQIDIVRLLATGSTYQEISQECGISINTVRTHIRRIYDALKVNNKFTLIQKWKDGEIG